MMNYSVCIPDRMDMVGHSEVPVEGAGTLLSSGKKSPGVAQGAAVHRHSLGRLHAINNSLKKKPKWIPEGKVNLPASPGTYSTKEIRYVHGLLMTSANSGALPGVVEGPIHAVLLFLLVALLGKKWVTHAARSARKAIG